MSRHITTGPPRQQAKHQTREQAIRNEPAARKQPPKPDVHPLAGSRRPDPVIELWVSKQLRDRIERNYAALAGERQDRRAKLDAEPQAEP